MSFLYNYREIAGKGLVVGACSLGRGRKGVVPQDCSKLKDKCSAAQKFLFISMLAREKKREERYTNADWFTKKYVVKSCFPSYSAYLL